MATMIKNQIVGQNQDQRVGQDQNQMEDRVIRTKDGVEIMMTIEMVEIVIEEIESTVVIEEISVVAEIMEDTMIEEDETMESKILHMIAQCIQKEISSNTKKADLIRTILLMHITNIAKTIRKSKNMSSIKITKLTLGLLRDTIQVRFIKISRIKSNWDNISPRSLLRILFKTIWLSI